ncbi:hypothetical protein NQ317_013148 [Molorchus minor]|uniref:Uncharacterized protein n=1 Tax=Molorchus minor TaxID=1323400 RepID=A0ABQ9JLD6_9CUCU|nr:hypothetical protein NQ317_013148 [Molorchus minor]
MQDLQSTFMRNPNQDDIPQCKHRLKMVIYLCPTDRKYACSWEGHSSDILDHFEKEHDDLLFFINSAVIDLKTSSENMLFFY